MIEPARTTLRAVRRRIHRPNQSLAAVILVAGLAALGGSAYAWWTTDASAEEPPMAGGTPKTAPTPAPIPPDIQEFLKQADAPTHTSATPWGLFVINPVIKGVAVLNPQNAPIPAMNGTQSKRLRAEGEGALAQANQAGFHTVDVPSQYRAGLSLVGVEAAREGNLFSVDMLYSSPRQATGMRSLRVTVFTPTEPVSFEEFPDTAIWDFAQSTDVNGLPTLSVVPDLHTSDQGDERIFAWSQGPAVYYIRTLGLFDNASLLALAREISAKEATR